MVFFQNRVNLAWMGLVTITCLAWLIVEEVSAGFFGSCAIILLSVLKVNIVSSVFMEVRHAALPGYAIFFKVWIFLVVIIFGGVFAYHRGLL